MQTEIRNFRGIASADLDIDKICLAAGPNEAGKTSTAQAVAAALTGEPMPIKGVSKASAGLLVRSGAANGSITLASQNGQTNIVYPSAKVKTEGVAPYASHFAAGIQSIVTMDDKDRIKILTEYLAAKPTRADLDKQLASLGLPVEVMDQLWKLIETQGWDNAYESIKTKGTKLKGQWEEVTGEKYGSKKGESWIPEGYEPDLMGMAEDTLKAIVTDAQDALEAAISSGAVEDFKADGLAELAALLEERTKAVELAKAFELDPSMFAQLEEANGFVEEMRNNLNGLQQQLRDLPRPDNTTGTPCPSCGTVLEIQGKTLTVLEVMPEEEKAARQAAITAMETKIAAVTSGLASHQSGADKAQQRINSAENDKSHAITDALRLLGESKEAAETLMAKPKEAAKQDLAEIERCRTALATAQSRLKAWGQKHAADARHTAICQNQELVNKTAPEGIRGDVLAKALKGFNALATPICTAASWRAVALEPDFTPTYGGTQYLLLSESAKWRVRTVLQMVMAKLDKSEALVIDAADILDKGGRNGLFKAVHGLGLPTLICMTLDSKELVPNLASAGIGASYWIEGGVAEGI